MAVCDHLPYQYISDDELYRFINSYSININYLSLVVLDSMTFNPLNFDHDELKNNTDPLSYNPINSTYISSQYVYLNDNKKTTI